jgi:hypothetical protein
VVTNAAIDHERAFELLPWLANGTLAGEERERVENHVRACLACRAELKEQRALHALISRHPTLHVSAERGFEQLRRQLEAADAGGAPSGKSERPRMRPPSRRSALAAMLVCGAIGISIWFGWTMRDRSAPAYVTLTEDAGRTGTYIDVIFSDGITEAQMRALLEEIGGTIVGGPSGLGRYTLRLDAEPLSDATVEALVRRLARDDERVRFAGRSFIAPRAPEPSE